MPPWLQPQARVLRHPPQRACSCPQRRPQKQFMRYRAQQGNQTLLRSSAPGARKAMEKAPCSSRYSLPPAFGWPLRATFPTPLHLPPSMAWAMAKACL
jgi:hypothetical protein